MSLTRNNPHLFNILKPVYHRNLLPICFIGTSVGSSLCREALATLEVINKIRCISFAIFSSSDYLLVSQKDVENI